MSLLEKALEAKTRRKSPTATPPYSKEALALAIAFLDGRVGSRNIQTALGLNFNNAVSAYSFVARTLRDAVQRGDIRITERREK